MSAATKKPIIAVVLAAGSSSRFGSTKQLATFEGVPLAKRATALAEASRAGATAVVVGHDWQAVTSAIFPCGAFLVQNDDYAAGVGSSLALAVRATRHAAGAILVLLADQPLITAEHLDGLITAWSGADDAIVATSFAGVSGPPVLFPSACFDDLAHLEGDAGARALLQDARFTVSEVAFADAAFDIDVPDDLSRLPRNARS